MAVDRERRDESIAAVAAFMRGDLGSAEILGIRKRVYGSGPQQDLIVMEVWSERSPLSSILQRGKRIAARPEEWEYLRRCIAILHTDIEWTYPEWPKEGCLSTIVELMPVIGSIVGMIVAAQILDGWPIIIWTIVGCIVAPVCMFIWTFRTDPIYAAPYPFASTEAFADAVPVLGHLHIPEYDSSLHGCSWFARNRAVLPYALFFAMIAAFWIALWPVALFATLREDRETREWHEALARSGG